MNYEDSLSMRYLFSSRDDLVITYRGKLTDKIKPLVLQRPCQRFGCHFYLDNGNIFLEEFVAEYFKVGGI
jgi:hypothetical protein